MGDTRHMRLSTLLVAALLATGCGGDGNLTEEEETTIASAHLISAAVAMYAVDEDKCLQEVEVTVCEGQGLAEEVDAVIAIYRDKPDATMDDLTMREHLQDIASTLDSAEPDLAARIDRALGS